MSSRFRLELSRLNSILILILIMSNDILAAFWILLPGPGLSFDTSALVLLRPSCPTASFASLFSFISVYGESSHAYFRQSISPTCIINTSCIYIDFLSAQFCIHSLPCIHCSSILEILHDFAALTRQCTFIIKALSRLIIDCIGAVCLFNT